MHYHEYRLPFERKRNKREPWLKSIRRETCIALLTRSRLCTSRSSTRTVTICGRLIARLIKTSRWNTFALLAMFQVTTSLFFLPGPYDCTSTLSTSLVCTPCATLDHGRNGHEYVPLNDAGKRDTTKVIRSGFHGLVRRIASSGQVAEHGGKYSTAFERIEAFAEDSRPLLRLVASKTITIERSHSQAIRALVPSPRRSTTRHNTISMRHTLSIGNWSTTDNMSFSR